MNCVAAAPGSGSALSSGAAGPDVKMPVASGNDARVGVATLRRSSVADTAGDTGISIMSSTIHRATQSRSGRVGSRVAAGDGEVSGIAATVWSGASDVLRKESVGSAPRMGEEV